MTCLDARAWYLPVISPAGIGKERMDVGHIDQVEV